MVQMNANKDQQTTIIQQGSLEIEKLTDLITGNGTIETTFDVPEGKIWTLYAGGLYVPSGLSVNGWSIQLTTDNGSNWYPIASYTTSDGDFILPVPLQLKYTCKIKIKATIVHSSDASIIRRILFQETDE